MSDSYVSLGGAAAATGLNYGDQKIYGLTRITRIYIFVALHFIGTILLCIAPFSKENPAEGWALEIIGQLMVLGGTCMMVTPGDQASKMFTESHRVATGIFLLTVLLTVILFAVIGSGAEIVALLPVIAEFLATLWYVANYLPFAQQWIKSMFPCGSSSSAAASPITG